MPLMVKISLLFTGTLILSKKQKLTLKLAFLFLFGGAFVIVLFNPFWEFFLDFNLFRSLNLVFLNTIGLLFLNFIYTLFEKKKNLIYYSLLFFLFFWFAMYLWCLTQGEITEFFFAFNLTLATLPSLFGLHILFSKNRSIKNQDLKKQLIFTVVGFLLILFFALLRNLFSIKLFSKSIFGVAFSIMIFLVASKIYPIIAGITKKRSFDCINHRSIPGYLKPVDVIEASTTTKGEKEISLLSALNRIYLAVLTISDDKLVIKEILRILGEISAANKIELYEVVLQENGNPRAIKNFEWNDEQNINGKNIFNWWLNKRYLKVWKECYPSLDMGKVILGCKGKMPGIRFKECGKEGFGSILMVPIRKEERLLGFLSFNMKSQGKLWSKDLKRMLLVAASLIGSLLTEKQLKKSLWEKRERYRVILENTFDLTCEISEEGNLLYISPNISKLTGFLDTELIGKSYFALIYEEDRPQVLANFEKATTHRHVVEAIYRIKRKNAEVCWLKSVGRLYQTPIRDQRWILVSSLIPDQVNLEEKIIEVNKKEIISILSESIANEFKDVLEELFREIKEAQVEFSSEPKVYIKLLKAEKALVRAEDLTRQLMTLASRRRPENRIFFIDQLLLDLLNPLLCGSKINYQLEIAKELWPVEADNEQIKQVFSNIIINAVQAMSEGGQLKIALNNQVIYKDTNLPLSVGKYVKVEIEDSGIGIDPKDLRRIFEPCFTTKPGGTGLGLSISFSVIKKYGGHIQVDSKPGKGSKFTISLPAKYEDFI